MSRHGIPLSLALLLIAPLLLAGCAETDDSRATVPTPGTSGGPGNGAGRALNELTIVASDYAFNVTPVSIPAGLARVRLENEGSQLHHAYFLKLDEGRTVEEAAAAMRNKSHPPEWAKAWGGPNAASPMGGNATVLMDLPAGTYALVCIIPAPDGKLHLEHGMVASLNVTNATGAPAPEPEADAVVELHDFNFTIRGNITRGNQTIKAVNLGQQPHELVIVKLDEGASVWDFVNATAPGAPPGPPPARGVGGIVGILPGHHQYIVAELGPGRYGIVCFLPDPQSHKEHFMLGMIGEFTVA